MDSRLPVTGNHGFLPPTSSLCREDFWKADYYGKPTERLRVVSYKGPTHFWVGINHLPTHIFHSVVALAFEQDNIAGNIQIPFVCSCRT